MLAAAQGMAYQASPVSTDAKPEVSKANAAGQSNSSGENPASIAANDFLTLLVTEMKNQDPTATTDPNQWVNQLVQVNSLQQLISINETLKGSAQRAPSVQSVVRVGSGKPEANEAITMPSGLRGADSSGSGAVSTQAGMFDADAAALRIANAMTSK